MDTDKPYSVCESSGITCRNDYLECSRYNGKVSGLCQSFDPDELGCALYCRTAILQPRFLDKVSDGFLYVCALFALSFNGVVDFVLEGFEKAFRSGRL
jgi:hypothetical protein